MQKVRSRVCLQCNIEFVPRHHGGTKQFCCYSCSNKYGWIHRKRKPKKEVFKVCVVCKNVYEMPQKYSIMQWDRRKYCSVKCAIESKKIKDGMNKGERHRRKRGMTKKGSEEWIEKIIARTKEGMNKPDVLEKLKKTKGSMSFEGKIIRSDALVGKMPSNLMYNSTYAHIQNGTYICSKGDVYFRSKWEANYALFLDFLIGNNDILNWEYEPDRFMFEKIKLGTRSYTPDFKVFNLNGSIEYHEVKGYMDSRSKTKLKRMDKYFPEIKLILVERKYYADILKKFKGIIKFYK